MSKNSTFYNLTVRHGRRFAEMYLELGNDAIYTNRLRKSFIAGTDISTMRRLMDRCYWEQRRKHKTKRK